MKIKFLDYIGPVKKLSKLMAVKKIINKFKRVPEDMRIYLIGVLVILSFYISKVLMGWLILGTIAFMVWKLNILNFKK